jgi:hypothetical protein
VATTFPTSPSVEVGEVLSSTKLAKQADAVNARLRSGLGEPWRIVYLMASLFRQMRNPEGTAFPPQFEFFRFYQHLDPSVAQWGAPVGDPGGINVTSSLASFIYGVDSADIDSEYSNLQSVPLLTTDDTPPTTPSEFWTLAKRQRGAAELVTGYSAAPMLDASDKFWQLYQGPRSPHGNAFGALLPGPSEASPCPDGTVPLDFFLTKIGSNPVVTVSWTTDCDLTPVTGTQIGTNVAFIFETETLIYVVKINGSFETFPRSEYIEGPYTENAKLRKTSAKMLDRVIALFASEFRGSTEQRVLLSDRLSYAFDYQRFFTSQYLLAPARGQVVGDSIIPLYPQARMDCSETNAKGARLTFNGGGGYPVTSGFVIASAIVRAVGLPLSSLTIDFRVGENIAEQLSIFLDSTGNGEALHTFSNPPKAGSALIVTIGDKIEGKAGARIEAEFAELKDYKPTIWDAYTLIRLSTGAVASVESQGTTETGSKEVFRSYVTKGCVTNLNGALDFPDAPENINQSAIYETARRLSKNVRIIPRQQLLGYEVTGGKSILYFKRHAFNLGFVDAFEGIAPTAAEILKDANANGIRAVAPSGGWSNEWLMGVDFKNSSGFNNNTSQFRPEVYSDYFALNNRCLFHSASLASGTNSRTRNHFVPGLANVATSTLAGNLIAEAPSSWNYGPTDNYGSSLNLEVCGAMDAACIANRINFYKSCRIYEPWPEIESVTSQMEGGVEVVKVTFKERIRSTLGEVAGAPATIARDMSTWNIAALKLEPFRCDENGIREYLWMQSSGVGCELYQAGNYAIDATLLSLPGGIIGACFPDFLFVKLIEKPFADDNDAQDAKDSPVTFDQEVAKEVYLRAICESFVDKLATVNQNCVASPSGVYNYTFENLQYQAHGHAWLPLMSKGDRSDAPRGFWPVPNTVLRAERFNQFSQAVNLLDTIPLMIPINVEGRLTTKAGTKLHTGIGWPNSADACSVTAGPTVKALVEISKIDMPTVVVGAWFSISGTQNLSAISVLSEGVCGAGGEWTQYQDTDSLEIRTVLDLGDQLNALPPTISSMVTNGEASVLYKTLKTENYNGITYVTDALQAEPCGGSRFHDGATYGYNFPSLGGVETVCRISDGLGVHDPTLEFTPRGWSFIQTDSPPPSFCSGGWAAYLEVDVLGSAFDRVLKIPLV